MRRLLPLTAALLVCLLGAAPNVAAEPLGGPRLAFVEWVSPRDEEKRSDFLLRTMGPEGKSVETLIGAGRRFTMGGGRISWTSDGSSLVVSGVFLAKGEQLEKGKEGWIYLIPADGGDPKRLPGTRGADEPVLSPDGRLLAFQRSRYRFHRNPKDPFKTRSFLGSTAWLLDRGTGRARQLTRWGNYSFAGPSSFSPDGSVLALDRSIGNGPEAVAYHVRSRKTRLIAAGAENPVYSPDGSRIALADFRDRIGVTVNGFDGEETVPVSELYTVDPDGSHPHRVTHSRIWQESMPSWDPSGERLSFIRSTAQFAVGLTNVVMESNADGSCPRILRGVLRPEEKYGPSLDGPGLFSPIWQPGPGREAGPISC